MTLGAFLGLSLESFESDAVALGGRLLLLVGLAVVAIMLVRPLDEGMGTDVDTSSTGGDPYLRIGLANMVRLAVVGAGLFGFFMFGLPGAVVLMAIVVGLYRSWASRADSRRSAAFAEQLPETLQLIAGSMRSGLSLLQAIDTVSLEAPMPTSEEFQRVLYENRLGRDMTESLGALSERMGSADFQWVVGAIEIHREVGGDLAEVLDRVADTVRGRNRVRAQVQALSAEGRLSGVVLSLLPPLMFVALAFLNPAYLGELTDRTIGWILIAISAGLLATGSIWLQRMAKFRF